MKSPAMLDRRKLCAKPPSAAELYALGTAHTNMRAGLAVLLGLAALLVMRPAQAVDGCRLMLCLAAPKWQEVPMCEPTVRQALRDLAHGKPFPRCPAAEPAADSNHDWAVAPDNCPPQYTIEIDGPGSKVYNCQFIGAMSIRIDGSLWTRTWWSLTGDSVTEYTPAAKIRLGTWDTRFDDDYALWLATQPPPSPPPLDTP